MDTGDQRGSPVKIPVNPGKRNIPKMELLYIQFGKFALLSSPAKIKKFTGSLVERVYLSAFEMFTWLYCCPPMAEDSKKIHWGNI